MSREAVVVGDEILPPAPDAIHPDLVPGVKFA